MSHRPFPATRPQLFTALWVAALLCSCSEAYEADGQLWPLGSTAGSGGAGGETMTPSGGTAGGGSVPEPTAGTGMVPGSGGSPGGVAGAGGSVSSGGGGNSGVAGSGVAGSSSGGASGNGGSGGAGQAGSAGAGMGGGNGSQSCSLKVGMTVSGITGNYAPRNAGVIWISNESGAFVKTLQLWAAARTKHLGAWKDATQAAGVSENKVDAVTGATVCPVPKCNPAKGSDVHMVTWDCTNYKKEKVPDGTYKVNFEATAINGRGPTRAESFVKGPSPATLMPPDSKPFTAMKLEYTP